MAQGKKFDIQVGDKVGYSAAFLRSVSGHGSTGRRRGVVTALEPLGEKTLVLIAWNDDPENPTRALAENIRPERTFHLEQ